MRNSNQPPVLSLKSSTWSRDSHGLYDYEAHGIHQKSLILPKPCHIFRVGNEIINVQSPSEVQAFNESTLLCKISQDAYDFSLTTNSDPFWHITKTMRTKYGPGAVLSLGDIIKLGRVSYRITAITAGHDQNLSDNTEDTDEGAYEIPGERDLGICRICFMESEPSNPLISPCKCIGSMKHIHLGCLQRWISSRMATKITDNCMVHSWKSMDCEICKSPFPFSVGKNEKEVELFKVERPNTPFIVLESVGYDRNSNRGVNVICVSDEKSVVLGRGHDADVRISDISVSRAHAVIKFREGEFIIEDNNSKFGTLIRAKDKITIGSNPITIQVGRTVISASTQGLGSDSLDI